MSSSRSAAKGKGKAALRPSQIQVGGVDDSPLWNHVKVTGGAAGGGGNRHWMCNYCNKKVTGSYSKVKGHLLAIPLCGVTACNNLSAEVMKAIKKEHDDAERKKNVRIMEARKQADYLTLPNGSDLLQNKKHKASGEKFDIDGHALTELAELSLDEPDLEAVTFDDNVEKEPVEVDELGAQNLDGDEME
ncbi:hypothetical protein RJ640_004273 [Escallonia rubra]|uniref:BED-type domain-containing protein n=1 Tax=Escallonia rubra TaxID=112253 RepID=A0AA88QV03_9ASTE|nr:hypothetical protein RJ640_004273 [Escallonia rubra]